MKRLLTIILLLLSSGFAASTALAREQTLLARITVYWPGGSGPERASFNGAKLHGGHCAVDPKKIPYGSQVIFPDESCVAIDSGPAVISRRAARRCGKTSEQRNALVIDRYFESKKLALAWAASNPHFMTVQVLDPHHKIAPKAEVDPKATVGVEAAQPNPTKTHWLNAGLAPADIRGPLIPLFVGGSLPRS
jgi:3D (Asp-Asp-Asp) domain-containing protein